MAKVKPGDGSRLKPMRGWQAWYRTVFGIDQAGHRYVVDARLLDEDARLYTDGSQTARSAIPATFPVEGGRIEVAASSFGLKRMHLVADDGPVTQLSPARGTAERWRAELGRRHPRLSRWLARAAVVVLLVGLAVALPALAEQITRIPPVAEEVGTFINPLDVPGEIAIGLTVAGVLAAIERALTLRNHWLIDFDTYWID